MGKKSIISGVLLLVVLGIGGWFFLCGREGGDLDLGFFQSGPGKRPGIEKSMHLQDGDKGKSGEKGVKGVSPEISGETGDAPRKKLAKPEVPALLEVRVFTGPGKKKRPVAGAKVFLFEKTGMYGKAWKERDRILAENPGLDYLPGNLRKRSRCFVTGQNGSAFLPVKGGGPLTRKGYGNLVWAESKDGRLRSVVCQLSRDERGEFWKDDDGRAKKIRGGILEVFLEPSPLVRVLVVDGAGKPVKGVPLGLFHCIFSPEKSRSLIAMTKTDSKGVGLFAGVREAAKALGRMKDYYVSFLFPVKEVKRFSARLKESNLRGEIVKLTLPPVGSVQVDVDGASRFEGGGGNVWVALVDPKRGWWDGWRNRWEWFWDRENLLKFSVPVVKGRALFPFVGLGMKLDVFCLRMGVLKIQKKEITGPSSPGEKVFVQVGAPPGDPVISLVLVDEKDLPLGGQDVKVAFPVSKIFDLRFNPRMGYELGVFRSGKDGRLRFPLPPTFTKGLLKQVELLGCEGRTSWKRRMAVLDLPPPFSQGLKDLGKVKFLYPPLLASGKVVDRKGAPVSGATVYVHSPVQRGKRGRACVRKCLTLEDGSFTIHGFWFWDRMKVNASQPSEGGAGPLTLPPGAKGIVLTLPGVGSVAGRALVGKPEFLEFPCVKFFLKRLVPGTKGWFASVRKKIEKDGSFHWTGLPPGLYEFFVKVNGEPKERYSVISGIRVLPGRTTRVPRLQNLDLRGLFEEIRVLVQDEEGRPMKLAYIPDWNVHSYSSDPGLLRILVGKGKRPVALVKARGYQGKKVKLLPGETIVVRLKKEPDRPRPRKGKRKVETGGAGRGYGGGF